MKDIFGIKNREKLDCGIRFANPDKKMQKKVKRFT